MEIQGLGGVPGQGATSSPISSRNGLGGKRKRSGLDFDGSPSTGGEHDEDETDRKRQPGVKRACNECRQQKVSHPSMVVTHYHFHRERNAWFQL